MKKPNLFIVGKPRSGTTSLYYYLKQHPDIFFPKEKEIGVFCSDLREESYRFHKKKNIDGFKGYTEQEYLKLYKKGKNEKYYGTATPIHLHSKKSAKEIYQFNPNSKIIATFRDPVNFLYSLYSRKILGPENAKSFREALKLEPLRKKGKKIPKDVIYPSNLFYMEQAEYLKDLKRFVEVFPKKQIYVNILEEFIKNKKKSYKKILKFLGVKTDFEANFERQNQNRYTPYPLIFSILKKGHAKKIAKQFLPRKIFIKIRNILIKEGRREKMDYDLKVQLKKQFKKDVIEFNNFLHKEGLIDKEINLVKL